MAFMLFVILVTGCIDEKLNDSLVFNINMEVTGDYSHPVIDLENITRTVEYIPGLKVPKYDIRTEFPYIECNAFYNMTRVSYDTSVPYAGPGNYSFRVIFFDNVQIPKANESVNVMIDFIDKDGTGIVRRYFAIKWPED